MSDQDLAGQVRRGASWSLLNTLVVRMGSLVLGIALARLLTPEEFGVFAIALTVQIVLMTLADLGLSADLVRSEDPERRAPTIATMSIVSGLTLAAAMTVSAGPVASLLGASSAAGAIAVLSFTLVLSTAAVVPFSHLQRTFAQGRLFATAAANFVVYTAVTLVLVIFFDMGPMGLAWGALSGQLVATVAQFVLAGMRPRFGFDRGVARTALSLGTPLAIANLLSWAVITFDNIAIAKIAGPAALGLYVLAFNVSNWPMNAIGQAVRSVSLAGFSEIARSRHQPEKVFLNALSLTWAAALPIGVLLAALSGPLVLLLYGERWSASATVLAALGFFGATRVAFDLMGTYLVAHGAARSVLVIQVIWTIALVPAVIVATQRWGIAGAGWSHVLVACVVVLPAYLLVLRRCGVPVRDVLAAMLPPTATAVPMWWFASMLGDAIESPFLALLAGGTVGLAMYALVMWSWVRRLLPERGRTAPAIPLADRAAVDPAA